MAQVLSIKLDGNFKRNVENTLSKWGYKYNYSRNSIEITSAPEGAAARLTEIMIREFKLDIQIDSLAFAYFIHAFGEIDGFGAMPWGEREEMLKSCYGISFSERTLKSWAAKLVERGILTKNGERCCWRTIKDTLGNSIRELVTGDTEVEAEARAYFLERLELVKKYGNTKESWERAFKELWNKYGCCYYYCKGFNLVAYDNYTAGLFQEIYELVEEILK